MVCQALATCLTFITLFNIYNPASNYNYPYFKDEKSGVGIGAQQVKLLLEMPVSHIRVCRIDPCFPLLLIQLPTNVHFRRHQVIAQVLGSLPPIWDTRMEFLAHSFSLVLPWLL